MGVNSPRLEATESLDVIWGAANIGRLIGVSTRRAFYLLEKGFIPGKKIGGTWCSTRSALARVLSHDPAAHIEAEKAA